MKKLLLFVALSGFFVSACLQGDPNPYDNAPATGGTGGTASGLRASAPPGSAIAPGTECSASNSTSVSLTFDNRTTKTLSVYWVDYSCAELLYQSVAPLSTYQVQSYAGHPFRLRDEASTLLYEYIPSAESTQTIVLE